MLLCCVLGVVEADAELCVDSLLSSPPAEHSSSEGKERSLILEMPVADHPIAFVQGLSMRPYQLQALAWMVTR